MKPNKKNIKKWVAALRSGEYRQARGKLGDRGGYCCLGVACEVAIKSGLKISKTTQNGEYVYDEFIGTLPKSVMEWLGVPNSDPELMAENGEPEYASVWNDDLNAKFPHIADLIEATYLA